MTARYPYGYGRPPAQLTAAELEQRTNWRNLHPEFRRRLVAMFDAAAAQGRVLGLGGGWRSTASQEQVFFARHEQVRIGGWDTFQMVPYLRAEAPELHAAAGALGNEPRRPYVPHVTIGLYSVSVPLKVVADRADRWESPSIVVPVTRLSLLSYEAADVAGPLTEVDSIDLTRPARTPPGTRSG